MKLTEIILTNAPAQISKEQEEQILKSLDAKSKPLIKITSTLELRTIEKNFFVLVKDGKAIGWLELGDPIKIKGIKYDTIKIIYLTSEVRGTFAAGAFLIALKKHLPNPLILGSDTHGGVLYKDGISLVKRMNKSATFDVKILDMKTGEKRDFDELEHKRGETLVFEETDFPLVTKVFNESIDVYVLEGCESEI